MKGEVCTFVAHHVSDPCMEPTAATEGEPDDAGDATEAIAGSADAFERLYRRHVAYVERMARWLLRHPDVEDAVQDAFIRVWDRLPQYRGEASFRTWMHAVALSVLLRRREKEDLRHSREDQEFLHNNEIAAPPVVPIDVIEMEDAIASLPAGARAVFVLHEVEGYSHDHIARQLEIQVSTSRSQLRHARKLLRETLSGLTDDE
jgi:RNA polymerase sigma factor (sigma-70 family)